MSLNFKKLDNKGIVFDVLILMYSIIGVIITLIVVGTLWVTFVSELRDSGMTENGYEAELNASIAATDEGFRTFDALLFPIAIIGLIVGLIISSFFIPSHPIFVVINIIGIIFLALMGLVMQVVYEQIVNNPEVASGYAYLTYIPYVMEWLPWIGVVAVLLATIVGYSKRSDGGVY